MKITPADIVLMALLSLLVISCWIRYILLFRISKAIYAVQKELAKSNRHARDCFDKLPLYENYTSFNFADEEHNGDSDKRNPDFK